MTTNGLRKFLGQGYENLPPEFLAELDKNFTPLDRAFPQERQLCNTTSGNQVFQLPDGTLTLVDYLFIKVDGSGNTVTIYPAAGQTINGASSKVLSTQYAKVLLVYSRSTADWITIA